MPVPGHGPVANARLRGSISDHRSAPIFGSATHVSASTSIGGSELPGMQHPATVLRSLYPPDFRGEPLSRHEKALDFR